VHPERAFCNLVQQTTANIENSIVEFEPVVMLAAKGDQTRTQSVLCGAVELWDIPTIAAQFGDKEADHLAREALHQHYPAKR
jgi:hypothetical protein